MRLLTGIVFSVLFSFMVLAACGKNHRQHAEDEYGVESSSVSFLPQTRTSPEPRVGDRVICPVTGTRLVVNEKTAFGWYEGKKVFLAARQYQERFEQDPEGYLLPDLKEILQEEAAREQESSSAQP